MKKVVIAQLSIQNNKINEFIELSKDMIQTSNAEDGCLSYKLLRDENQHSEFCFYESYQDEKALEFHNSSLHLKSFFGGVMPLLASEPKIEVFNGKE